MSCTHRHHLIVTLIDFTQAEGLRSDHVAYAEQPGNPGDKPNNWPLYTVHRHMACGVTCSGSWSKQPDDTSQNLLYTSA